MKIIFTTLIASMLLSSCAIGVKPWERDLLAKPPMELTYHSIQQGFDDHIFFSKEASSGGQGFGGGGCGCN